MFVLGPGRSSKISPLGSLVASRNATIGQSAIVDEATLLTFMCNITNIVGWLCTANRSAGDDGHNESGKKENEIVYSQRARQTRIWTAFRGGSSNHMSEIGTIG